MNADLEKLILLQTVDSDIARKENLLKTIPEEIQSGYVTCEAAKKTLKDFDDHEQADQKLRRSLEADVEDLQTKIAETKGKLPTVKTNVEYRALVKEQDNFGKKIAALEEKQIELMESQESRSGDRNGLVDILSAEEKSFATIKKEKEAAMEDVRADLEKLVKKRADIISGITASIYNNYEKVLKARGGIGVARVIDQLCQACNQVVPPQLYYLVKSSDDIHKCPHCSRSLYFMPEDVQSGVE